jgi:hypothetical protein
VKKYIAFALALIEGGPALANEDTLDSPHISVAAARGIPVALNRFRKDQPKAVAEQVDLRARDHRLR